MVNLVAVDAVTETIVPGMVEIDQTRLVSFLQNREIVVYDSGSQLRMLKSIFGPEYNWDWFKKNGYHSFKRKVNERYPLPWMKVRFPIYYELYIDAGQKVKEVTQGMGLDDWDISDYEPLPHWKPCASYSPTGEFDLTASNFRVPTHSQTFSAQNAWLCEVAQLNPYAQKILINTQAAKKRGIKD